MYHLGLPLPGPLLVCFPPQLLCQAMKTHHEVSWLVTHWQGVSLPPFPSHVHGWGGGCHGWTNVVVIILGAPSWSLSANYAVEWEWATHIPLERGGAAAVVSSLLRCVEVCLLDLHPERGGGALGHVGVCGWEWVEVARASVVVVGWERTNQHQWLMSDSNSALNQRLRSIQTPIVPIIK